MDWAAAFGFAIIMLYIAVQIRSLISAWELSRLFFSFLIIVWALVDYGIIKYLINEVN
jgi:glucan phosphoethanolaminetransferase (alkaline phosphatase superfamily)